jgi:hypothetical protein
VRIGDDYRGRTYLLYFAEPDNLAGAEHKTGKHDEAQDAAAPVVEQEVLHNPETSPIVRFYRDSQHVSACS